MNYNIYSKDLLTGASLYAVATSMFYQDKVLRALRKQELHADMSDYKLNIMINSFTNQFWIDVFGKKTSTNVFFS